MKRRTFTAMALSSLLIAPPNAGPARASGSAIPGYQIADIINGRLTIGYGGMATPDQPVDNSTLFQAASCSKTVACLAGLTLVRDGRIALDQPANTYLRRWQLPGPQGAKATVADLMSHTAGTTVHGFEGYGRDEPLPGLLDILNGTAPANSDPVRMRRFRLSAFSYSGGGSTVLQTLIEDVTGIDFANYAEAKVLRPAGATRATFAITPSAPFAHGTFDNGRPVPGGYRRHPESAAAGLWATAADLAKIMQAIVLSLRGASGALLPVSLAERMVAPVSAGVGLGVFVHPGPIIEHTGANYGFNSVMAANLVTGTVRTGMVNQNGAIDGYIERVIAS